MIMITKKEIIPILALNAIRHTPSQRPCRFQRHVSLFTRFVSVPASSNCPF